MKDLVGEKFRIFSQPALKTVRVIPTGSPPCRTILDSFVLTLWLRRFLLRRNGCVVRKRSEVLFIRHSRGLAMSEVKCPHCGGSNESDAAFCGVCGTPLPAQLAQSPAAANSTAPGPAASGTQPPAGAIPAQPSAYPPTGANAATGAYAALPPGAIPAPHGVYPPGHPVYQQGVPGTMIPGSMVTGQNTKWAIGLGIAALFCCGPFTAIPGIFLAKKDMDEFASGRAPYLNASSAKSAFYLNIVALILSIIGIFFFWGRTGLHGF